MITGATVIFVTGFLAVVVGVTVLARGSRRRRWAQLLAVVGVVVLFVGLLVRSARPQPDPCADADARTCAIVPSSGP